jgi:hypothetical protein
VKILGSTLLILFTVSAFASSEWECDYNSPVGLTKIFAKSDSDECPLTLTAAPYTKMVAKTEARTVTVTFWRSEQAEFWKDSKVKYSECRYQSKDIYVPGGANQADVSLVCIKK